MRMRFKPYARPELNACSFSVNEPLLNKGKWHDSFVRKQPIHLELGCGKGGFLSRLAVAHPEINYLGIDITDKVLILAKRNIDRQYAAAQRDPDNVQIMSLDIERIYNAFDNTDTVDRIYINFCNPWNKKVGHKKHRLTHTKQLLLYREFLKDGGEIYFKTDDDDLFADSLHYFPEAGFEITWKTFDLHKNEPDWNIRTEHEQMFTEMGIPTKALIAVKKELHCRPILNKKESVKMEKQSIHTSNAPAALGPYSQAVKAGNTIYVSGQIPINPATGEFAGSDIATQTRQALTNISNILKEAGAEMSNVVKTTVLLQHIEDFAAMNEVYAEFFEQPYPARAAFEVAALPKDALVEIECIAVV